MEVEVSTVLAERRRHGGEGRLLGLLAACALHAVVLALLVFGPPARADRDRAPEYVAVTIVPAQALGVPEPPPRPAPVAAPPRAEAMPSPEKKKPSAEKPAPAPAAPAAAAPETGPAPRQGSPEGSPSGVSALGAAVAGLDNPDFTYGYYVEQMLALIRAQWVRPPLGGGIEAVLHFSILLDGRIADVRIVESSGYSSFDLAALRALQSASPLPPLPKSYRQDSLGVTLIVR